MSDIEKIRHSFAHVLAHAVKELYPKSKLGMGPAIENGFYYDFDNLNISEDDISKIEKKMKDIVKEDLKIKKILLKRKDAEKKLKGEKYKLELLKELKDKNISFYEQGNFIDLCKGPHVSSTGKLNIKAFKLTKIAGAYWKGNSKNKMLTRIYGVAFENAKELKNYLKFLEEAEKRNHIKIGKELDLFSFHAEAPGMPFWHPKGMVIYNKLLKLARNENKKRNYEEIMTPTILNSSLWKLSGHWDNFKDDMYFTKIDKKEFAVKPMNCPGGLLIYKTNLHSYKELPLRRAEFGYVHRHELSGVLNGLFRVRAFTQDDAHSFCTEEQVESEIIDMVEYAVNLYGLFGFKDIGTYIATKPDKSIGSDRVWKIATDALKNALKKKNMEYGIKKGEGAFYGPKIEFNIKDALGRNWQCGTIQVDFSMPERFKATYESKDGRKKTPVMIHRAILGSLERFIGILIEHYAGKFPLWLAPVQVKILTINDSNLKFAKEVYDKLRENNIRVELDDRRESIPKKVRDAQKEKIPLAITIGDKEVKKKSLAIRTLDGKVKFDVKVDAFVKEILNKIKKRN